MARRTKKQSRYEFLISRHFTPLEARELSTLKKETPALKEAIKRRAIRRTQFEKQAARKIASGAWSRDIVPKKWAENLSRLYTTRNWRVVEGARGDQQPMPVGSPNPWAMYRAYEKIAPPSKDVSPWQLRKVFGKTRLERGLIYIQRAERRGGMSQTQLRLWITEKSNAIKRARGGHRAQLIVEKSRLEKLLE